MYATALPSPWIPLESLWVAISQLFPSPTDRWRGESEIDLTDEQRDLLAKLLDPVKPDTVPGTFRGAFMSLLNTKWAMCMSGDWNHVHHDAEQPHPLFGKLVPHGMNGVSQVLAATRQMIDGLGLVPYRAEIVFLKPAFLEEDRFLIDFARTSTDYEFTIRACSDDTEGRDVTKVHLTLREGTWSDEAWFRTHMMLWRMSATLAETWPGCLYAKQTVTFHRPLAGDTLATRVRGTGRNTRGHCTAYTQVHSPRSPLLPSVTGQATVVLPKAA
jgi:acyl dehydratase